MKIIYITLTLITILLPSKLLSAEYSEEKIKHYASLMRRPPEAWLYVRSLPPESITKLVDLLDFQHHNNGTNMHYFSFTCALAETLEEKQLEFDENYIFMKLSSFVISAIENGDENLAAVAFHSLSKLKHPSLHKLALEVEESGNEQNRKAARNWLKSNSQNKGDQKGLHSNAAKPLNKEHSTLNNDQQNITEKSQSTRWIIWVIVGLVLIILLYMFSKKQRSS